VLSNAAVTVQEVMYLSALLALKQSETQEKVVNLLSKTIELHLGTVQVSFLSSLLHCFLR